MRRYKNYIFDLYGTLIDIHTDEEKMPLWKTLATFYSHYGVDYRPHELKYAYKRTVKDEEKQLKNKAIDYPEIDLEKVFIRLLKEAPKGHPTTRLVQDEEEWAVAVANIFRIESYKKINVYKNAEKVLSSLKVRGANLYLLSNAQRSFTIPEFETSGLSRFFKASYISSDAGIKKPDPQFLEMLLSAEGLDRKDCVMVGNDLDSDMKMAGDCGMDGILINTFPYSAAELNKKNVYNFPVIRDLKELL